MSTLLDIFKRHGTDKWRHGYHAVYEKLPEPKRLLEVGVYKGASLHAWLEWWPKTYIIGMDTFERGWPDPVEAPTPLRLICGDSRTWKPKDERLYGTVDLIIDDGSHKPRDQAATFRNLWPLLARGGRYFVEDVMLIDGIHSLPAWFAARSADFNREAFLELMAAMHEANVQPTAHDFRAQSGLPDSVLLCIQKPL